MCVCVCVCMCVCVYSPRRKTSLKDNTWVVDTKLSVAFNLFN